VAQAGRIAGPVYDTQASREVRHALMESLPLARPHDLTRHGVGARHSEESPSGCEALRHRVSVLCVARLLEQVAEGLDVEGTLVRRQGQFRLVLSITSITRSVAVEVEASDVESHTH
jgi:hypothetical protein